MARETSMAEEARRRFYDARSGRPPRHEAGSQVEPNVAAPPAESTLTPLDEDAILLAQEADMFAPERPRRDIEPARRPVGAHLYAIATVAWLFSIDPVYQALTPRNFHGIPAFQLLALFFVLAAMLILTLWVWARWLPAPLRISLRTQLGHWKRWLAAGFVALMVWQHVG